MGMPYESPPRNHNWNVYFWPWRLQALPLELLGFWALQSESASCLASHQEGSGELLDAGLHNKNHSKLRAWEGNCELRKESKSPCSTPASTRAAARLAWETKGPISTPLEALSLFTLTHFKGLFWMSHVCMCLCVGLCTEGPVPTEIRRGLSEPREQPTVCWN